MKVLFNTLKFFIKYVHEDTHDVHLNVAIKTPETTNGRVIVSPKAMARTAPKKGATEKYAAVRAVPKFRNPITNRAKLMP
jgi:hypothetical protein